MIHPYTAIRYFLHSQMLMSCYFLFQIFFRIVYKYCVGRLSLSVRKNFSDVLFRLSVLYTYQKYLMVEGVCFVFGDFLVLLSGNSFSCSGWAF